MKTSFLDALKGKDKDSIQTYCSEIFQNGNIQEMKGVVQAIITLIGSKYNSHHFTFHDFSLLIDLSNISLENTQEILFQLVTTPTDREIFIPLEIYCKLIDLSINTKKEHMLTQLLQYHLIPDNKVIAMKLISYKHQSSSLFYAGIDILKRTNKYEELIDIYLSQGDIFMALRLADLSRRSISTQTIKSCLLKLNNSVITAQFEYEYQQLI
ncbi:hypothetical protein EHI8A_189630 [Entamoeba histolytica HM-1:IMSS-B]|uniref:Mic1 domain-containing protein n=6 Tax=Entamoeba histolytica TaxID=5759 RepID=C4M778_ENTH1|nr:hypothetical protein EHI_199710 [Entamoeba histolytica HM-1:IMSS]EMD43451.1 Hypothetical protein EHI5A_167190 [Entamoeba histolytica KU27]EMH74638.1 hypothetical protein EHI8A_189630 [Entamoeba histolytica HM-1:IMSS-B]EMS15209.1 hypothetical protein KM1_215130 [Entamoeba histolytica HM-3:IMSS]ENY65667.1 hypothetical protein EHI7A_130220 [Entamoeba histolytica HM-1:IMSS-A]EAL49362.1 hypothetical protein EHI_199710 [Entamoeba histolytica HM-1:IMSS]|eukprot:XP_654749.1 hypothetical protein EHI_199710 [Entamoeba histolytica HM-1:IMSS]